MLEKDGKIIWTDRVKNLEGWYSVNEERTIYVQQKSREANWIGHILSRNCPLKHATEQKTEGKTEARGRRGVRRKQLLDDLKETRG